MNSPLQTSIPEYFGDPSGKLDGPIGWIVKDPATARIYMKTSRAGEKGSWRSISPVVYKGAGISFTSFNLTIPAGKTYQFGTEAKGVVPGAGLGSLVGVSMVPAKPAILVFGAVTANNWVTITLWNASDADVAIADNTSFYTWVIPLGDITVNPLEPSPPPLVGPGPIVPPEPEPIPLPVEPPPPVHPQPPGMPTSPLLKDSPPEIKVYG